MEKIVCKKLSFAYPKSEYQALKSVDFSVENGEFCLVIGKSAAGKSTLLKLMKKEIAPFGTLDGDIEIFGSVGYVAQNVEENIVCDKVRGELSFGLTNMGMRGEQIDLLVAETASYFNLESKLDSDISSLSGGEKQMVNLAAVMIMKPDILVLDEPTSQLDPVSSERFIQMIKRLHREFGITVIISEHSLDNLFDSASKILLIDNGVLKCDLAPDDAARFLRSYGGGIEKIVPVERRLFDNAKTVSECREILKGKSLAQKPLVDEKTDIAAKIRALCFAYQKGNDVLFNLSLNVYKGKINAVLGPNSSGKSTLLKTVAGVCKAHRGRIKADGRVSMLCQNVYDLFTKETCGEEIEFGEITHYLGIDDIKERHPYDLSGGQAQRLALAKVLATGADIILLDEPTKSFDCVLKSRLGELLRDLCAQGKTILLVSHDIEFVGEYADYVSFLSRGKIIGTRSRREFFSSLNFYTTSVSKITKNICENVVSVDDLREAGGIE